MHRSANAARKTKIQCQELFTSSQPPASAHHQHHQREHARRLDLVEAVADHRPDHHHSRRAAERLREAQRHELVDRSGGRAPQRGDREQRDAGDERRLAAVAVGDRAEGELPEREAEKVGGERVLHARRAGAELGLQRGQRRQVHVDRERADRHDQPEHQGEPRYPFTHETGYFARPGPVAVLPGGVSLPSALARCLLRPERWVP
jgi:hypothetical protein